MVLSVDDQRAIYAAAQTHGGSLAAAFAASAKRYQQYSQSTRVPTYAAIWRSSPWRDSR
jgi:hypothetical protein